MTSNVIIYSGISEGRFENSAREVFLTIRTGEVYFPELIHLLTHFATWFYEFMTTVSPPVAPGAKPQKLQGSSRGKSTEAPAVFRCLMSGNT